MKDFMTKEMYEVDCNRYLWPMRDIRDQVSALIEADFNVDEAAAKITAKRVTYPRLCIDDYPGCCGLDLLDRYPNHGFRREWDVKKIIQERDDGYTGLYHADDVEGRKAFNALFKAHGLGTKAMLVDRAWGKYTVIEGREEWAEFVASKIAELPAGARQVMTVNESMRRAARELQTNGRGIIAVDNITREHQGSTNGRSVGDVGPIGWRHLAYYLENVPEGIAFGIGVSYSEPFDNGGTVLQTFTFVPECRAV